MIMAKQKDYTFLAAIGFLAAVIGQVALAQNTAVPFIVLVVTSLIVAAVAAIAANGGIPKKLGTLSAGGGEGQGPLVSRFAAVFAIMLVVMLAVSIGGFTQR